MLPRYLGTALVMPFLMMCTELTAQDQARYAVTISGGLGTSNQENANSAVGRLGLDVEYSLAGPWRVGMGGRYSLIAAYSLCDGSGSADGTTTVSAVAAYLLVHSNAGGDGPGVFAMAGPGYMYRERFQYCAETNGSIGLVPAVHAGSLCAVASAGFETGSVIGDFLKFRFGAEYLYMTATTSAPSFWLSTLTAGIGASW